MGPGQRPERAVRLREEGQDEVQPESRGENHRLPTSRNGDHGCRKRSTDASKPWGDNDTPSQETLDICQIQKNYS